MGRQMTPAQDYRFYGFLNFDHKHSVGFLEWGLARRKASTHTLQHENGQNLYIHSSSEIRTQYSSV
jgi:hypothetical protein